ncbi:DUF6233 domain-containing protein [Streptomyces sp. NPDC001480]|uniref:DUF6233 domain-containing protein n=1 Tax=Streptomyces sp. NPDC001480 TaxID=3364577 RepID=UPI0036B72996
MNEVLERSGAPVTTAELARCRPVTRQQVLEALRRRVPACIHCRPDTALGILNQLRAGRRATGRSAPGPRVPVGKGSPHDMVLARADADRGRGQPRPAASARTGSATQAEAARFSSPRRRSASRRSSSAITGR